MKTPTPKSKTANGIGRKPTHAVEERTAKTAYSSVAVRGAIGLRSSFFFCYFSFWSSKKKSKSTMGANDNDHGWHRLKLIALRRPNHEKNNNFSHEHL